MFLHNLKYNFKILTHNKPLLFWNFIFIIAMSIFFRLTFSNVYSTETFSTLNVAVIKNDEYQKDQYFSHVISKLEKTNLDGSTIDSEKDTTNSQKLLQISYVNTVKEADALLENKQVIEKQFSKRSLKSFLINALSSIISSLRFNHKLHNK